MNLSNLQEKIVVLFEAQSTFTIWGFSAMGHREVAHLLNISPASASNSMRSLYNTGYFYNKTSRDEWDETTYYFVNANQKKVSHNCYGQPVLINK